MYYDRTLTESFADLLKIGGGLRWLFEYVKNNEELDFLIGKNKSKEWISVYRGLTRIFTIHPKGNATIYVDGDIKYKKLLPDLFGIRSNTQSFQQEIELLIDRITADSQFDRYYKNKKEGYYQSILSRKFGICGNPMDEFVILDKEVVIGYENEDEKENLFGVIQLKYKQLQCAISKIDPIEYGSDLSEKAIGNELDFLALDREGNLLLIEYKHGTNTSGIYLSPLQIGLYFDVFNKYRDLTNQKLESTLFKMLEQKQRIGLVNKDWIRPVSIKAIIPVLIISECNYRSCAKDKFSKILNICRNNFGLNYLNDLRTYNYTVQNGLSPW